MFNGGPTDPTGVRAYIEVKTDERSSLWDQISNNNRETKGESRGPSGRRERLADHLTQVVGIEPTTHGTPGSVPVWMSPLLVLPPSCMRKKLDAMVVLEAQLLGERRQRDTTGQ